MKSSSSCNLHSAWLLDDKSQLDLTVIKPFNDYATSLSDCAGMLMFCSFILI